jgi:hypothetical protein
MLINVNGQSYTSWEDVPPEVRAQLAATLPDADKNGVPDLFETGALPTGPSTFTTSSLVVNGQPVQSAADLPPEIQAKLQQALGMLGPMLGGVAAPSASGPLQPGHVMLNGVPTVVGDSTPPKKGFFRRLFGG